MPQASDELRAYWGGISEGPAIEHLRRQGYVLTSRWTWRRPHPAYEPTERDLKAIEFLIDEWDFGGLEEKAANDDAAWSWTYPGGPLGKNGARAPSTPEWVWFLNFACDGETLTVHDLEGTLRVRKGETLCRAADGRMWVRRSTTSPINPCPDRDRSINIDFTNRVD